MEHSDFIVLFEKILPEGLDRRFEVRDAVSDGLELAMPLASPLEVELNLALHAGRVLVRGWVAGSVALECSRCLKGFTLPLDSKVETYLEIAADGATEADHELPREEMDTRLIEKGRIDLRDIIAEQIHLAVPVKTLCLEECRGLCSHCGVDLNSGDCSCGEDQTDSRWDALKELKER
jgi:uncharacterized protein